MGAQLKVELNNKLFLKNPEDTLLGKSIIKHSISLIYKLGWEDFTFKKLAIEINTTEATIYRYFENKHKLLLYLVSIYWSWLDYQVLFLTQNIKSAEAKLKRVLKLIVMEQEDLLKLGDFDIKKLHELVISESSKVYFNKQVEADNKVRLFKPYKDLCARIAEIMKEYNPQFKYANSLSSTIMEAAHQQYYFKAHLPALTDLGKKNTGNSIYNFLALLVFQSLKK